MTKEELTVKLADLIIMLNDEREYSVEDVLSKCFNLYIDNQG